MKFKVGDEVRCVKYFKDYSDKVPMTLEEMENNFKEHIELIKKKIKFTISAICTDSLSMYRCVTEVDLESTEFHTFSFTEEEIEHYNRSWKERLQ